MKKIDFCASLVAMACFTCTPQQRAEAVADLSKVGACVLTSIAEGGLDDPTLIAQRCADSTLSIIGAVVDEWLAASANQPDAANLVAASPLHVRFAIVSQKVHARLAGDQ